jgi:hypothetical protein
MSRIARLPGLAVVPGLIDENCCEPRHLRLARRIPAAGRAPQRMSDQTTPGQATRTAVQAVREPSSQAARNIRFPASALEDRGQMMGIILE